jgi:hypothetical protein
VSNATSAGVNVSTAAGNKTDAGDVPRNLACASWEDLRWDAADALACLDKIRRLVEADLESAINWYYAKKRRKVWYSQGLRLAAVLFGTIGAAIPFLASTGLGREVSELTILRTNQWGYVFIVIAGGCVAVDKLFGFSTNWIRFVDAATRIQTILGKFRIEWYKQLAVADMAANRAESVDRLFATLQDCATRTREVIEEETGAWIAEFRSSLTKLAEESQAARAAREQQTQGQVDEIKKVARERAEKTGAITVSIKNFAQLPDTFMWTLDLDNEPWKSRIDRAAFIVKGLDPGTYLVAARGVVDGRVLRDARPVVVQTGEQTVAELELT